MNIQALQNTDIDLLKELQPETWSDIRPYFYYYSASAFCRPLKFSENGQVIAVGTNIQHQDSAWLAHIIVHPQFRNRGLGNEMAGALINDLDRARFKTISLDATEMGYPVYRKLGFEIEAEYIHLNGQHTDLSLMDPATIVPYNSSYRDQLLELDREISAENRVQVLEPHFLSALLYLSKGKVTGAYLPSLLDGFVLAANELAGTELMKIRMRQKYTARFPSANQPCIDFLLNNGYQVTGSSKRMFLGEKREWKDKGIFNRISGGLG